MEIAQSRSVYQDEGQSSNFIDEMFQDDPAEAKIYCSNIEARIVDTAIFGIDLYDLAIEPLHSIADEAPDNIDIDKPDGWSLMGDSWSDDHEEFLPEVREAFRLMAMAGIMPDLADIEEFPRQE